ncbi:hypothetical protein LSE41_001034, partial [Campylobacter jejuni]|nr:hypothetical protein [Campylobacter jejuni]
LRNTSDLLVSLSTQLIKTNYNSIPCFINPWEYDRQYIFNNQWICQRYSEIFGKENLIVRLFDKNEFYQGDLLKDFIHTIGLKWDGRFVIPSKQNESLDLIGIEFCKALNIKNNNYNFVELYDKYFTSKCLFLKFKPPKKIMQSYLDYFEKSNEWVRKEFFPFKERLFQKQDLSNYKENYKLKEMKSEYWDKIAEFILDVVKTKDKIIEGKDIIIQSKIMQFNQIQTKLFFQVKYGTAKSRIQNQLSYKLGQTMIVNSKSFLGYLIMPIALLSTVVSYRQYQKIYQEKIKKDFSLKLPSLKQYPDYQEAIKLKNHISYKLGEALIKAHKNWYGGGGYIKFLFEIYKLRKK